MSGKSVNFKAEGKIWRRSWCSIFLNTCIGADYVVKDIQVKPGKKITCTAFTTFYTSAGSQSQIRIQREQNHACSPATLRKRLITYMRTDSVNLSNTALADISNRVKEMYGEEYHQFRRYKTKARALRRRTKAIRPTYMSNTTGKQWLEEVVRIDLKRTMARQMADAQLERTIAKLKFLPIKKNWLPPVRL